MLETGRVKEQELFDLAAIQRATAELLKEWADRCSQETKRKILREKEARTKARQHLSDRRTAAYKFLKDQGVVPQVGPLDIPLAVRREAALVYIRETYPELGF